MTYPKNTPEPAGEVDASALRAYVDRLVRVHEERNALGKDLADILQEAASSGFVKEAVKHCVKLSLADADKRLKMRESEDIAEVYASALGFSQ